MQKTYYLSLLFFISLLVGSLVWLIPAGDITLAHKIQASFHYTFYQVLALVLSTFTLKKLKISETEIGILEKLLLGNIGLAIILVLIRFLTKFDIDTAFFITSIYFIIIIYLSPDKYRNTFKINRHEIIVIIFAFITPLLFGNEVLNHFILNSETITFKPWVDYFIHSGHVLQMSEGNLKNGLFMASGIDVGLYHYAQYMLSAFIYSVGNIPLLTVTTNILFPHGILLLFFSIYLLSTLLWNRKTGLLVAIFFFALPDATFQIFENLRLGTHWLLIASPGLIWGLAIIFLSSKYCIQFLQNKNWQYLSLGLFLAVSVVFFRAHFFIIGVTALSLSVIIASDFIKPIMKWVGVLTIFVSLVIFLAIIDEYLFFPFFKDKSHIGWYIEQVFNRDFSELYKAILKYPLYQCILTFIYLLCVCGWYLPLMCLSKFAHSNYNRKLFVIFPTSLLFCFTLNIWLIPRTSFGTYAEMVNRPQVLIYSFVFLWSMGMTLAIVEHTRIFKKYGLIIGITVALIIMHFKPYESNTWGVNRSYPADLYYAAKYISNQNRPDHRVLDTDYDPTNFIIAISEKKSFLSRFNEWEKRKLSSERNINRFSKLAKANSISQEIFNTHSLTMAKNIAKEHKIGWILVGPNKNVNWSHQARPAYQSGEYIVYDMDNLIAR